MSSFIHVWYLAESVAQENLKVGNETTISEKKEAGSLTSGFSVQSQEKSDNTTQNTENE